MADQASRFGQPEKICDIVLKGGITSGVVYPLALVSLAEKYRFSNIGGTSAGAIAAAAAAAAEYGRHTQAAGFDRLARIPDEVGSGLLSMFQPTPALKPLFDIFVAALKAKTKIGRIVAITGAAVGGYWPSALLGLLPGVAVASFAPAIGGGTGFVAFGLLLALTGLVAAVIWRLVKAANTDLVDNDFGLCPGIRQPDSSKEGFTDWLARLIDEAAGNKTGRPLTFGDLAAPPNGRPAIQLAMMTTSLMEKRPYTLPMPEDHRFVFEKSEWDRIFPSGVMAFLSRECEPFTPPAGEAGEYYHFPDPARLPLIVGARMSLSFPLLISAVPLWRRDFTLLEEAERNKLRRCLFSDGGLSSNFPIHFFDRLLPNTPTFAISLDDYDEKRNRDDVWLPSSQRQRKPVAGSAVRRPRWIPDAAAHVGQGLAGQSAKHASRIPGADRACRAQAGGGRTESRHGRSDHPQARQLRRAGRRDAVRRIRSRWTSMASFSGRDGQDGGNARRGREGL